MKKNEPIGLARVVYEEPVVVRNVEVVYVAVGLLVELELLPSETWVAISLSHFSVSRGCSAVAALGVAVVRVGDGGIASGVEAEHVVDHIQVF